METLNKISLVSLSSIALFAAVLAVNTPIPANYQFELNLGNSSVLDKQDGNKVSVGSSDEYIFVAENSRYWM
tara:strand:- start:1120 stop:1335 length:216 start_codon:yes stop_codon:yes gene_type:complete